MKRPWPIVGLGEILTHRKDFIVIDDLQTYKRARVQLHAQGIVLRDEVPGAMIKTKRQQLCRAGEFLVAEIDAKVGGFGIVPPELEGAIVSSHYFLFGAKDDRLDRRFLGWFIKTPSFRHQVGAQGSTNYAAIRPADVLSYEIPLPSLGEQRRIVSRIDQLSAKVNEARCLRQQSSAQTVALLPSTTAHVFAQSKADGWQRGKLGDYVLDDCYGTSERANDDETGVPVLRMGNIQNGRIDLRSLKYLHLSQRDRERLLLEVGDILVNRTNSAELVGKCAVFELPGEYSFASYLIRLRLDDTRADPRLVAAYINSPIGRSYMLREKRQMTGQANVNATKLKALPIALPSLIDQQRIVAYLERSQATFEGLKRVQAETAAELDAMLPAILDRAFEGEL